MFTWTLGLRLLVVIESLSHVYMGIRNEIISSRNLVTFNFYFYVDNSTKKILELVSHVYMDIMCVN